MRKLIFACFFLSGASGLVFELVWTRELTLVFGSTTLAISTVVSVFMGGLGLGSWIAGRVADRVRDPLGLYALAEAGVGLYAALLPFVFGAYPRLHPLLARLVEGGGGGSGGETHPLGFSLLRFLATAVILVLPTTLMGATLPLLSRHLVRAARELPELGARVGSLYAANTLGAVFGTALAGFVLLPELGVVRTNLCAAVTNLLLGALVLWARRRSERLAALATPAPPEGPPEPEPAPEPELEPSPGALEADGASRTEEDFAADIESVSETTPEPPAPPLLPERARRVVLGAFAVSGATAMTCQVLWSRALAIVIGSSVYSFTLILLAFLIGLGGGAAIFSRLAARVRRPILWLGAVHLGLLLLVGLSLLAIDELPGLFLALLRPREGQTTAFAVDEILTYQFLIAALPVLPTTLLMGGVLPFTLRILAADVERVGRDVGRAYAVNTLGAIVGSVVAGFAVLPLLGLDRGLRAVVITSGALAAAIFAVGCMSEVARAPRRLLAGLALCAALALALWMPRWDLGHFQTGVFRVSVSKQILESGRWHVPELLYYRDGLSTTVSVERWGKHVALKNNGKVDASNGDDMATQIMVGLMPLLIHPTALDRPPRVAVIGYGSGVTVGAALQFPVGHADVVELEPAVVEAARYFDDVNHRPERDPRMTLWADDGRNFLSAGVTGGAYDVIISEPSNPWITGVSNLFTRDYWQAAAARLAEDGIFCQWAQLYEISPLHVKTILHTFSEVFPHTYVFSSEDRSSDLILVAAKRPLRLDRVRLARNFDVPSVRAELGRAKVRAVEDLLANVLLTPEELPAFTAGAPINTDDNALIEFGAPRDLLGYQPYDSYLAEVYGGSWPYGRIECCLEGLGAGPARAAALVRLAEGLLQHGKRDVARRFFTRVQKTQEAGGAAAIPEDFRRVGRLLDLLSPRAATDPEVPLASEADPLDPPKPPAGLKDAEGVVFARDYATVEEAARRRLWEGALHIVDAWPERYLTEGGQDLALLVGYLLYKDERWDDAKVLLGPLARDERYAARRPAVLYYLGRAEYDMGRPGEAMRLMRRYLEATGGVKAGPP